MTHRDTIPIGPLVTHIFESDARLHARWADVQNRWGLLLLAQGRATDAVAVFRRCLEINSRYAWSGVNLVQSLAIAGDVPGARLVLPSIHLPAPWFRPFLDAFLLLAEGNPRAGRAAIDTLDLPIRRRMDVRRLTFALARRAGDADAKNLWTEIIYDPDTNALALHSLLSEQRYGEPGSALTSLLPGMHQLFVAAGRMEARMGNLEEAERLASMAFLTWPDLAQNLNQRAFLHELRDENDEAVALYREAARLAPEDPASFISLAYFWSAQGDLGQAFESLASALERAPRYADLHHQMGLLRRAREENEEALASFQKALEINPRYLMARLDTAMTLFLLGRWRDSLASFEQVLENGLRSSDVLGTMGRIHMELGDPKMARSSLMEARCLNENDPEVLYWLGQVLFEASETEEASKVWRRFLDLEPEGDRTVSVRARLVAIGEHLGRETEA